MSIVLLGSTSGSCTLQEQAVAGTTTLTLPTFNGTVGLLVSGTAVASTSGTSIDFTSIPAGVRRITVMFNGVSTSGVSSPLIQLGSGSPTTSGYLGVGSRWVGSGTGETAFTTGLGLNGVQAAYLYRGAIVFNLLGSNAWIGVANMSETSANVMFMSTTSVTLSGTLDRVRITTVNGTDTFDAGTINILYE
jgi:hypothetical protein